jgi:uncharacterized lipoprotein YehR (DUF1307 family)
MKMRILTSVAAAAVLAVSLSACQKKAEETNTAETAAPADTNTMAAPADTNTMATNEAGMATNMEATTNTTP